MIHPLGHVGAHQFNLINNEKAFNRYGAAVGTIAKDSDVNKDGIPDRTDWNDYVFRTGKTSDNSLAISGGSEKATYYASLRYADQNGILYGNKLQTGSVRANVEVRPKRKKTVKSDFMAFRVWPCQLPGELSIDALRSDPP